jgi:hypothetical protein
MRGSVPRAGSPDHTGALELSGLHFFLLTYTDFSISVVSPGGYHLHWFVVYLLRRGARLKSDGPDVQAALVRPRRSQKS